VIRPRGVGNVDRLVLRARVELGDEARTRMQGASAGDGLDRGDLSGLEGRITTGDSNGTYPLLGQCGAVGSQY
jgi:hypothetical protein